MGKNKQVLLSSTGILSELIRYVFFRSYENNKYTRLRRVQNNHKRLQRLLRVLVTAKHHAGLQATPRHFARTMLQHHGGGRRKYLDILCIHRLKVQLSYSQDWEPQLKQLKPMNVANTQVRQILCFFDFIDKELHIFCSVAEERETLGTQSHIAQKKSSKPFRQLMDHQ